MTEKQDSGEANNSESAPSWPRALIGGAFSAIPGAKEQYDGAIRTVAVAFFANLTVAISKFAGFLVVPSSALLAEGIHSTAVTINQGLMLRGRLNSNLPATPEYSFGFGRERYFWGLMVSVVMFGFGAVLSAGRGVLALLGDGGHHEMALIWVPYAALTVGLVMDGSSLLQGLREARREKGDFSLWAYIKRARNPEVPVVIMEDSAAMVGLFFAYVGITLAIVTGNAMYDGIASILIGCVLAVVAGILGWKMKALLVGQSALPEERDLINKVLSEHKNTREVIYARSLYLAPDDLLIEAQVRMDAELRFHDIVDAIEEMEQGIRKQLPHARLIAIEPAVYVPDDTETPGYEEDG